MGETDTSNGKKHGLQYLELKALSVPSSLRFLIGVEYDIVLCVTDVGGRRSCSIRFPLLANSFRTLLQVCVGRFGLTCTHYDDHSVLSGTATMPLLRYIDYLPGALHMDELMDCLGVKPMTSPARIGDSAHDFSASFIDYSEYSSDASLADVHCTGYYLTVDFGLPIATHGHLIEIHFHKECTVDDALREFVEFSGWNTLDLRFFDDNDKHLGGVIVLPSIQDACDVFEKYEDEDSDDDLDLLPFVLRPVSPLVPVPCVEDSALKKQREQLWPEIEAFWTRLPRWQHCVVVSNLYDAASLEETLAFFDGLPIAASSLVEDKSPARRRRVFITFATADAARRALLLDGKSTKGKTLRVQVSPPYMDESRRGRVVGAEPAATPERPDADAATGDAAGDRDEDTLKEAKEQQTPASTMNANAREFVPSSFPLNANSPKFYPASVPLSFQEDLPPPPAYVQAATPPIIPACLSLSASANMMRPIPQVPQVVSTPPPYTAPPPYGSASAIAVHGVPQLPRTP